MTLHYVSVFTTEKGAARGAKIKILEENIINLVPKCPLQSNFENENPHFMFLFTYKKITDVFEILRCIFKMSVFQFFSKEQVMYNYSGSIYRCRHPERFALSHTVVFPLNLCNQFKQNACGSITKICLVVVILCRYIKIHHYCKNLI